MRSFIVIAVAVAGCHFSALPVRTDPAENDLGQANIDNDMSIDDMSFTDLGNDNDMAHGDPASDMSTPIDMITIVIPPVDLAVAPSPDMSLKCGFGDGGSGVPCPGDMSDHFDLAHSIFDMAMETCYNGSCWVCGGSPTVEEPCCASTNSCSAGYNCKSGTATPHPWDNFVGTCVPCGGMNQPLCAP